MIPIRTRYIPSLIELKSKISEINQSICNGDHLPHYMTYLKSERDRLQRILKLITSERPKIGFQVSPSDIASHIIKEDHMFIEFEKESTNPTFGDVADGQLFVDREGYLCQKSADNYNEAWCIADENGKPKAEMFNYENFTTVTKILPLIKKISF